MNHWWRAYNEAVNDPKLQLLSDFLFRVWFNLMCIASGNNGNLPALKDLAFTLRLAPAKAAQALAELHAAGLLDKTETGFAPHNWSGRQYKSDVSTERVKRFRNGRRNVSRNDGEALQKRPQNTESETETEINTEANASGADAPLDPSIAEREFFARGREILGKSAGGQLAKLKAAKGGNVALARAVLETASTRDKPSEYVAGAIRNGNSARPLTAFQQSRQQTQEILHELDDFATGGSRRNQTHSGILSGDSGERPKELCSGPSSAVIDLSVSRSGPRS